jgi:mRNA interferase MazF
MIMKKYDVWLADLDPSFGTEAGKKRPVVVVQTDFLNGRHTSTIICPTTTILTRTTRLTRIQLQRGDANLYEDSDILVDQVRAIDNHRFIKKIGILPTKYHKPLDENLRDILDLA